MEMGTIDAAVIGGVIAVVSALVRVIEKLVDRATARRNGASAEESKKEMEDEWRRRLQTEEIWLFQRKHGQHTVDAVARIEGDVAHVKRKVGA